MTNSNIKRLADRLAGWYDNFAPYEPPEQSDYFFIQLDNRDNREPLLDILKETANEMDKTIESDMKSYTELLLIINEIEKL